jgi:hypothetical protein
VLLAAALAVGLRLFFSYLFGRAFSRLDAAALYRRYDQNRFPGRSSSDRL